MSTCCQTSTRDPYVTVGTHSNRRPLLAYAHRSYVEAWSENVPVVHLLALNLEASDHKYFLLGLETDDYIEESTSLVHHAEQNFER